MRLNFRFFAFVFLLSVFVGCTPKVTRIDPNEQVDLSGRWNDTDSQLTAEEMIRSSLSESWLRRFREKNDRQPVVIVGTIINKTSEFIDANTFVKDMEREFIKSGLVRVVQNEQLREKIRGERADQQDFSSPETQKKFGKELGADFMIFGNIASIIDQAGNKKLIFYKVNLELADMETNELVWVGDKEIKKLRTR